MDKLKGFLGWFWVAKWRLLIPVILLVGAFFVLRSRTSKGMPQYQTANVERGTLVSSVTASGKALTTSALYISTSASGLVKKLYVKDGDKVSAGQRIAQITLDSDGAIQNAKAWASLVSSQNSLNAANNNYRATQAAVQDIYDQVKGHSSDETPAQKDIRTKAEVSNDNAYDAVKGAQANLVSAQASYAATSPTIVAPASGVLSSLNLVEGMVITQTSSSGTISSQKVAVIGNQMPPIVSVTLSEVDVPKIKLDEKATVTFDSLTDKTFTGVVATVDRVGTVSSNVTSYTSNIKLDSINDAILPNMAANAKIITNVKDNVLLIPSTAIQSVNGTAIVRVLKDGQVNVVTVETGEQNDTQTEITSGLSEADVVVTSIINSSSTTRNSTGTSVFGGGARGGFGGGGNVRIIGR